MNDMGLSQKQLEIQYIVYNILWFKLYVVFWRCFAATHIICLMYKIHTVEMFSIYLQSMPEGHPVMRALARCKNKVYPQASRNACADAL